MAKRLLRSAARASPQRCVFYDLETSYAGPYAKGMFRGPKGATRRNLIVEIGALSVPDNVVFHRLVDPRLKGVDLKTTFEATGQDVGRTMRSWKRLFQEKNIMPEEETKIATEAFDELFSNRDLFTPARQAIAEFIAFVYNRDVRCPPIVAHSGTSFDHNVLRHHCLRLKLPLLEPKRMLDSIPVAKRCVPGLKSYSLSALHETVFGEKFDLAHHAMADVHALVRIMRHFAQQHRVPVHALWSTPRAGGDTPLVALRGVGPKTAAALRDAGYDMATLRAAVLQQSEVPPGIKARVRNHKALWKNLKKQLSSPKTTRSKRMGRDKKTNSNQPRQSRRREIISRAQKTRSKSV